MGVGVSGASSAVVEDYRGCLEAVGVSFPAYFVPSKN